MCIIARRRTYAFAVGIADTEAVEAPNPDQLTVVCVSKTAGMASKDDGEQELQEGDSASSPYVPPPTLQSQSTSPPDAPGSTATSAGDGTPSLSDLADNKFMGQKERRRSSAVKMFLGDYLGLTSNPSVLKLLAKQGPTSLPPKIST